MDLLRRGRNIKDDNSNSNNFLRNNPSDIPPGFPPDFPFDPLPPSNSPTFPSTPSFPTAPPFYSFLPTPSFAPLTSSTPPLPDHDTTFAEKKALCDFDPKISTSQKPRIILMPKVEEIPKTEGKIIIPELLNQLFPGVQKIFDGEKANEEPKTEYPLPKYGEIMEELNQDNIPPQLDFFLGGQNLGLENRIM